MHPRGDMNNVPLTKNERRTRSLISVSSILVFLASLAAVLFAVAGLVTPQPLTMAACAAIAAASALLFQGFAVALRWGKATHVVGRERADLLGIFAEITGGGTSIVLALMALDGYAPATNLTIAAVVLGVSLLLSGRTQGDLVWLAPTVESRLDVPREIEASSSAVMIAGGFVTLLFGIASIVASSPAPIVFAMVCGAAALLFAGGSLFARFTRALG
jgi:hypothetical protein